MASSLSPSKADMDTETSFSKIKKVRRKVYGSALEEGQGKENNDDVLLKTDFLDVEKPLTMNTLFAEEKDDSSVINSATDEESSALDFQNSLAEEHDDNGDEQPEENAPGFTDDDGSAELDATDERSTQTSYKNFEDEKVPEKAINNKLEKIMIDAGQTEDNEMDDTSVRNNSTAEQITKESADQIEENCIDSNLKNDDTHKEKDEIMQDDVPGRTNIMHKSATPLLSILEESGAPASSQDLIFTQTTDEQPDDDALIASVDNLFLHADKETVTVKDIVTALEDEFGVKLAKKTKAIVRERLKDLVQGTVKPNGGEEEDETDNAESEEENGESESEADNDEDETSDVEQDTRQPRRKKPSRKTPKQRSSSRRSTKPKKPSAVRIHAEMLRKKRMEELRVRHEELQLQQNKEDQERAEQIAARFDTNTDELRMKRIEDRLDLMQKLDQKRIQVISGDVISVKEPIRKGVPAAALTSESDSDSDSDMELEIVDSNGRSHEQLSPSKPSIAPKITAQSKALNILNRLGRGQMESVQPSMTSNKKVSWSEAGATATTSPGKSLSARAALRSTLLSRQRKMGNLWLARELGYTSEQDHLRDCLQVEEQKRIIMIKKEEERLKRNERKQLRERMLITEDVVGNDETEENEDNSQDQPVAEEEDEELALAKEIENEDTHVDDLSVSKTLGDDDHNLEDEEGIKADSICGEKTINGDDQSVAFGDEDDKTTAFGNDEDHTVVFTNEDDMTVVFPNDDGASAQHATATDETNSEPPLIVTTSSSMSEKANADGSDEDDDDRTDVKDPGKTSGEPYEVHSNENDESMGERQTKDETIIESKKAKNSGWQEMLKKEAEKMKKLKKRKGNGLVEAEADEEEEEDVVAGLEDFGFSLTKKKNDDDEGEEDDDELDEEDLKHVVDDVSDDEGDEEAGEKARKELMKREEREQHKEMLRRMREGYDGRRGGIAGGGVGARGLHRFDQLVAADNREDAKRLGLLNDDELESEDEEGENSNSGPDSGEIEDETALLDKMLKDRFLHRSSVEVEENFSDDEDGIDGPSEGNAEATNEEDAEEREQELLARRFAKRARMQRLIETHGDDEEFSQLRLIDKDQKMKEELMSMKEVVGPRKRQISASSNSNLGTNSQSTSSASSSQSLFASQSGSLTLALKASSQRKNKTSFLGGGAANKDKVSGVHRSIALNHVVFQTENSQSLCAISSQKKSMPAKRKLATTTSSSLWDKVSANSFRKKSKRY